MKRVPVDRRFERVCPGIYFEASILRRNRSMQDLEGRQGREGRENRQEEIAPEEARDYLRQCKFHLASGLTYQGSDKEIEAEINSQLTRYLHTIRRIPATQPEPRILELGSAPFLMSALIRRFRTCRLELSMYYQPEEFSSPLTLEHLGSGEKSVMPFKSFNVEKDRFPYPDGSFDVVLCCELLEHLIFNPLHLLSEIHRVLAKEGFLVLTTPNIIRVSNILMLLRGQNIYDPYYTGSTYARHTRVYTLEEVRTLLDQTGFSSISLTTEHIFSGPSTWKSAVIDSATRLICALMDKRHSSRNGAGSVRGDTIFTLVKRKDQFVEKVPPSIIIGDRERLTKQRDAFPSII
jgi:SAM-dependent methyltransferase